MQAGARLAQLATAPQVLALYRTILKHGRSWHNRDDGVFIKREAQLLFRKNKALTEPAEIEKKLLEADTRLQLALHYRNPHPRIFYGPPGHTPERIRTHATAVREP